MVVPISVNAGVMIGDKLYETYADNYVKLRGTLAYIENGYLKYEGNTHELPSGKIIGLIKVKKELVVVYEDKILTESGQSWDLETKKNIRIFIENDLIRVMNGNDIHFIGINTINFDGVILNFSIKSPLWDPEIYRVYTIDESGKFTCFNVTTSVKLFVFDKQAKIIRIFGEYTEFEIQLAIPIRYIVNFTTGFNFIAKSEVLAIYPNGQNMIVEYEEMPFFVCIELGSAHQELIDDPNTGPKSASNT